VLAAAADRATPPIGTPVLVEASGAAQALVTELIQERLDVLDL
jgi:hypothetical protein